MSTARPSDGHWRAAVAFKAVASGGELVPALDRVARHAPDRVVFEPWRVALSACSTCHHTVRQQLAGELFANRRIARSVRLLQFCPSFFNDAQQNGELAWRETRQNIRRDERRP